MIVGLTLTVVLLVPEVRQLRRRSLPASAAAPAEAEAAEPEAVEEIADALR